MPATSTTEVQPEAPAGAPQQQLFEVDTAADVIDATDGVLSLREAIETANAVPGLDIVTFADALRGERIVLDAANGSLRISDDLIIDGDPLDRVRVVDVLPEDREPAGITIDGGFDDDTPGVVPIEVAGAYLGLDDLTIENAYSTGIRGTDADIAGARIAVQLINGSPGSGVAIDMQGGSLQLLDSSIGYTALPFEVTGIRVDDTPVALYGSRIEFVNSDIGYGITGTTPAVVLFESAIASARGTLGGAISITGDVLIDGSTISESGGRYIAGSAVEVDGNLVLLNSTIADAQTPLDPLGPIGAAIAVPAGASAQIAQSTITGSRDFYTAPEGAPGLGIRADAGSVVEIRNSIIDDGVAGTIVSNGANTFRDAVVDGALPGDQLGVDAFDLFNPVFLDDGFSSGVLADNGGPTETVALRNDPGNPAIDAADPATASAVDQRGFARDAAPDIGAFEAGAAPPPLVGDEGLTVTTDADAVVVDGEVSLREAVLTANSLAGPDIVTFAGDLGGATITLTEGDLVVTDDLLVDGDLQDGGPGAITVSGGLFGDNLNQYGLPGFVPFEARNTTLGLQDMTIVEASGIAVRGTQADLEIDRVLIDGIGGPQLSPVQGVTVDGGSLALSDSTIRGFSSEIAFGIRFTNDAEIEMRNSAIVDGGSGFGGGIDGVGTVAIVDSTIAGNVSLYGGVGVGVDGQLTIENSTIADNGAIVRDVAESAGIAIDGELQIVNSTIAGNRGVGIVSRPDSDVQIVQSTITGSYATGDNNDATPEPTTGIGVAPGATVSLTNSIVDDAVEGTISSNGANTFRDTVVSGAEASDQLGIDAQQLFALTTEIGASGVRAGVPSENGGPTATIALLDDPANPAVDAADAAAAPALDQRVATRGATPDIGAFELGAPIVTPPSAPPLPDLAENVPLADADILGAPRSFSTLLGDDAALRFVDEYTAEQNSLGVYLIGPDGSIGSTEWVFERIEHAEPNDLASASARPGGGPLAPEDTVLLSELFDPAELGPGVAFGLFLVGDGAARNPLTVFDGGTLAFRSDGDTARITDATPQLVHTAENGVERLVEGDILHAADADQRDPATNPLNPTGEGQVTSGLLDGLFTIAFEDQPLAESDRDFNDALVAIDLLDGADDPLAVADSAGAPADSASVETLLTPTETA